MVDWAQPREDMTATQYIYANVLAGIGLGLGATLVALIFRAIGMRA